MATAQEEKDEQAFFAERVKEQNQQERKPQTMPTEPHKPTPPTKDIPVKDTTPPYVQPKTDVDPIHIAVTNCPNFRDSIIAILEGVAADINVAADDPNQVRKVAAQLKERSGTWADAAVANTNYAPVATVETEKGRKEREEREGKEKK